MTVDLDLTTLTLAQWDAAVAAAIHDRDFESVAGLIALMAIHGHAKEAEELRQLILDLVHATQETSDA